MATVTEMQLLAGKAMYEARFRRELFADPLATAKEMGIELDYDQAAYIQSLDPDAIDRLATEVQVILPLPKTMTWGRAATTALPPELLE